MDGQVIAVSISATHSFSKPNADCIRLLAGLGVEGDAHAGETVKHRSRVRRDPTAANQFILLAGGERPYTLRQVWHDMDRVWTSLFARFGWMNVRPPVWVWFAWSGIAALAAIGAL